MFKKAYFRVSEVSKDVASNKKAVIATDFFGRKMSGFFDDSYIRKGQLEVKTVQEEGDTVLVMCPGEGFLEQDRYITVCKYDIEYPKD
ncbi:hypothetical protein GOV14_04545 [Candidatus Pacearchaeota archaeon]|nr:hypothetical protein [Candidatus Pacearchaeota archaeon]